MTIERHISPGAGAITDSVHLTVEENDTLDKAQEIIRNRAEREKVSLNKDAVKWSLLGVLRAEGIEAMLKYARNAKIQRPRVTRAVGYAQYN